MVIGIDIDDTITDTTINANCYLKLFCSSVSDYHELSKERYFEFLNNYLADIVLTNPLKENVKEVVDKLHDLGCTIIFITARNNIYTKNVKENTLEYLKKHDIYFDDILFDEEGKGLKGALAKNHNVQLFIDDKENVLDEVHTYGIECIRFTKDKSKYQTFDNWLDIKKYIERILKDGR